MKRCICIAGAMLLCAAMAWGQETSPATDTIWIDSIGTHSGQQAAIGIYFENADSLKGIDLTLSYGYPDIFIDSVSFVGSRVEDNNLMLFSDVDTAGAWLRAVSMIIDPTSTPIPSGRGLFATAYVTVPEAYPDRLIVFDTLTVTTPLTFISWDNMSFTPQFRPGYINNDFAPATQDSVWIDSVEVDPGHAFSLVVHASNAEPLSGIHLPLSYYSDDIILDSAVIAGTRSESAVTFDTSVNNQAKEAIIHIGFADTHLLEGGSGPVARLYLSCEPDGTSPLVPVDTTGIDGSGLYFQLGPPLSDVKAYPDFGKGVISVNIQTIASEEEDALPGRFELMQNKPNPFNPTTSISFSLPERSHVRLEVFNVLGQRVRLLADASFPSGNHSIIFDGRDDSRQNLASGIYLYRIKTDRHEDSRKMILLK